MGKKIDAKIIKKILLCIFSGGVVFSFLLNIYFIFLAKKLPLIPKTDLASTKVLKIIDGDTFDTANGERIRLYEINAPENPNECMGEDAKNRLENLLQDKTISLEKFGKDNFGRTLAHVYQGTLFINEILVEEGLAYFEKGKVQNPKSLQIEQTENKAKLASRGVWSSLCQTKKDGCIIKGNYRSADNTRIYHTPDCYNYDKITIKPGTTDRWFCSESEAITAGFRKSRDCPK